MKLYLQFSCFNFFNFVLKQSTDLIHSSPVPLGLPLLHTTFVNKTSPWNLGAELAHEQKQHCAPAGSAWNVKEQNKNKKKKTGGTCLKTVHHLDDFCWLLPLLHHVQLGSAVPLVVSDVDGHLGGLQPLVAATLAATPLIHVLETGIRWEIRSEIRSRWINIDKSSAYSRKWWPCTSVMLQISPSPGRWWSSHPCWSCSRTFPPPWPWWPNDPWCAGGVSRSCRWSPRAENLKPRLLSVKEGMTGQKGIYKTCKWNAANRWQAQELGSIDTMSPTPGLHKSHYFCFNLLSDSDEQIINAANNI